MFEYHAYNVKGRVISELLRLAQAGDSSVNEVTIVIRDRDMATRVGTTRANVTNINRSLKEAGVILRTGQSVRILDVESLRGMLPECEFS